jgi:hypothetical protein
LHLGQLLMFVIVPSPLIRATYDSKNKNAVQCLTERHFSELWRCR